jgi:hypothetical protein
MGRSIPVNEVFAEWRRAPEYVAAYDALRDEFALASTLIEARAWAGMTQDEVAAGGGPSTP